MIQVTDKYSIDVRGYANFVVYEKKESQSQRERKDRTWGNPTYYTKLEEALRNVMYRNQADALMDKDVTLSEAIQIIQKANQSIEEEIHQAFVLAQETMPNVASIDSDDEE